MSAARAGDSRDSIPRWASAAFLSGSGLGADHSAAARLRDVFIGEAFDFLRLSGIRGKCLAKVSRKLDRWGVRFILSQVSFSLSL